MKTTSLLKAALFVVLAAAQPLLAQQLNWTVNILPPGSCTITWSTTLPGQSGTLLKSGKITCNKGSTINFHFAPASGYKLIHVVKEAYDEIDWVNRNGGNDSFGPVDASESVTAVCELLNPVGDFTLDSSNAVNATKMGSPTGTYTGDVLDSTAPAGKRPYTAVVTMDESGKLDVVGTVVGVKNKDGSSNLTAGGSVKTVNGEPKTEYKGSLTGTLDGKPLSGSGSSTLPLALQDNGSNPPTADGIVAGSAKLDGTKYSEKATPVSVPFKAAEAAQIKSSWNFDLTITEETVKGKNVVYASGILNLPNGDRTSFAKKTAKYAAKTGYSVSFTAGTKIDGSGNPLLDLKGKPIKDKKSTVTIKCMTLTKPAATWVPNGGTMAYAFLGQKGSGQLVDFLP